MDDCKIVDLYFKRQEDAITETDKKYGKYCYSICYNLLRSKEDSEECVNDTYTRLWNLIPPAIPISLKAFIAKIARNVALNRYDYIHAQKRHVESAVILDEFWECITTSTPSFEENIALKQAINDFLSNLDRKQRIIFLQRYWYFCSIEEIAENNGLGISNVKTTLHRLRKAFKSYLEKEGIEL